MNASLWRKCWIILSVGALGLLVSGCQISVGFGVSWPIYRSSVDSLSDRQLCQLNGNTDGEQLRQEMTERNLLTRTDRRNLRAGRFSEEMSRCGMLALLGEPDRRLTIHRSSEPSLTAYAYRCEANPALGCPFSAVLIEDRSITEVRTLERNELRDRTYL